MARKKKPHDPLLWFNSSPEVIRLVVVMYVLTSQDAKRLAKSAE